MKKEEFKIDPERIIKYVSVKDSVEDSNWIVSLYNEIQEKGEKVICDGPFNGAKALEFKPGHYVCLIHTPFVKGKFFPCRIESALMQLDYARFN